MTNVKLSATEIELMSNASIILTKNKIIEEVYQLFGSLSNNYKGLLQKENCLPTEATAIAPKIARGENYEGLPWVTLDYPRYFTNKHVFAIRTFFWWGNFCSITLQLKGDYLNTVNTQSLMQYCNDWHLCCNTIEWEHHFRATNYLPVNSFTIEEVKQLQFIKLAKKIPLQQWDDIEKFFNQNFENLVQLLATQAMK